ncbi:PREDICTED: protein LNK3 isoform X2 [Tarenaya hassleriana]|uniref:protein LNK3 isoform X2 n=1 Tax=Tarenaya hassleriana TaxID=28532 RepID=UPI00053C15D6|nr:PREDICTED: protein LNK3 isoform X2 [Tarenaya hassleriana]
MDGYLGRSFDDFVVPKCQESSDAFAAPDFWGGWAMNIPEAPEKCFIMDHYDAMNHGFSGGLYSQMETRSIQESKKLNIYADLCSETKDDHRQLHDFDGIQQMDDIFLSILEDVPGNWSRDPSSGLGCLKPSNDYVDSSTFVDSLSCDVPMSPFAPCSSGPCHDMPLKGQRPFTVLDLSEGDRSNEYSEVEASMEEEVLHDLQRATEKLTDETRKCFRDTFYRLAKNSVHDPEDHRPAQARGSHGGDQSDRIRSRRQHGTESETNSIDRAIANLTFNKMESNIEMFPLPEKGSEGSSKRRTRY